MCRYIGNQFYVCTSGSVGFHSGLDFPKVWILAHDALHPQGGTLKISETAKFWSQLSVSLGILKHPWFVLFFLVWIHFFAQISWKKWWGWGWSGGINQFCWPAVQNFEVDFDCTRICEKTLNGQDPKCFLPPTALLSQGRFFFDVVTYPPWVKAWLHVTWINRDGICGAVFEDFGLWTADFFRVFSDVPMARKSTNGLGGGQHNWFRCKSSLICLPIAGWWKLLG